MLTLVLACPATFGLSISEAWGLQGNFVPCGWELFLECCSGICGMLMYVIWWLSGNLAWVYGIWGYFLRSLRIENLKLQRISKLGMATAWDGAHDRRKEKNNREHLAASSFHIGYVEVSRKASATNTNIRKPQTTMRTLHWYSQGRPPFAVSSLFHR